MGGRLDSQLRRRIENSRIDKYKVDEIVAYLQSNFPEYRRLKNFSRRVENTLGSLQRTNYAVLGSEMDGGEEDEDINNVDLTTPIRSPARKKHKRVSEKEESVGGSGRMRRNCDNGSASASSKDEGAISTNEDAVYDEKVEPEFDVMDLASLPSHPPFGSRPKNEAVWLEACRLANPEEAKAVISRGVKAIPTSVKLWMQAAKLEHDEGLEIDFIPISIFNFIPISIFRVSSLCSS